MNKIYRFDTDADDLWLDGVERVISPNYDDRPADTEVDLLVIHGISLPPNEFGGMYVRQLFSNCLDPGEHPYFKEIEQLRVSSHLFINRQGELTQFVAFNKRAWHAGESEFCGRSVCNDFSIGIELEGTDDQPYESAQYECLGNVTEFLLSQWSGINKERIVGHSDIAPGRKTDPGPFFQWDRYFKMLDQMNSV